MDNSENEKRESSEVGAGDRSRSPKPDTPDSVGRRDMLRVIGSVPAALIPLSPALAQQSKRAPTRPQPGATPAGGPPYQPKVLSEHEWKTVTVLSDIIIPADERSGSATQAGVPEFVDDWLAFAAGGIRLLPQIRGGLTWLDIECRRIFDNDFIDCSGAQQKQILDRIAYPKLAAREDAVGVAFFTQLRNLVVSGFFSSKMGVHDLPYLGNTMVAEWNGCPSKVRAKLGLSDEGTKT